jgi:VIT1/CCC1 family predicted Fe2+/Mn2+ transporter
VDGVVGRKATTDQLDVAAPPLIPPSVVRGAAANGSAVDAATPAREAGIRAPREAVKTAAIDPGRDEAHRSQRAGWLRAAVLGADDGIVATASLMIGVAASSAPAGQVLVAGLAGLVAGALSMAAGEYVSVSSQRDAENADVALEISEHHRDPAYELAELTSLYVGRGVDPGLAAQVAEQLSARDAVGAHLRDEFGFTPHGRARPGQAGMVSAASFALGAAMPIISALLAPSAERILVIAAAALAVLALLGTAGAHARGAKRARGALRVVLGGGLAMGATALIGKVIGGVGL